MKGHIIILSLIEIFPFERVFIILRTAAEI